MSKTLLFCAFTVLGLITLLPTLARADGEGQTPPQTLYATEYHMWFSIRTTLIDRLGGVPIVDPEEIRAAHKEQWWGDPVSTSPTASRAEKR